MTENVEDLPSPEPKNSYVCWMDIMGTGNRMYQNISSVAQRLLNFQILAKDFSNRNTTIYPMMDGIYIVSGSIDHMISFLESTFKQAARQVVKRDTKDTFIVRGGVSYGPIVEGKDFSIGLDEDSYKQNIESLLIGPPMVEAYGIEEDAPPFGIAVHESARSFTQHNFEFKWYEWFTPDNRELANELRKQIESYFDYHEKHSHLTNYDKEDIADHKNMMQMYLPEVKLKSGE